MPNGENERAAEFAAVLRRHQSFDGPVFTWSCGCGVDFHDVTGDHIQHLARVLAGVFQ